MYCSESILDVQIVSFSKLKNVTLYLKGGLTNEAAAIKDNFCRLNCVQDHGRRLDCAGSERVRLRAISTIKRI